MTTTLYRSLILIIFISGYATLDIQEIQNLKRVKFDPLSFNPSYEPNNLRVDIIRQTITESYGDSSGSYSETRNIPYHVIGFDLGNGLFFDLNKNLSFRIDSLLKIRKSSDFSITITNYHGTGRRSMKYQLKNDSLLVCYPPRNKEHFRYVVNGTPDSLNFKYKGRKNFLIRFDQNDEIYKSGKRPKTILYQPSTGEYLLVYKNRERVYHSSGGELYLEKYFRIRMNNDHTVIEIRRGRGRHRFIYSIIKTDCCIYVFNRTFQGLKIKQVKTRTELYRNRKLITEFSAAD